MGTKAKQKRPQGREVIALDPDRLVFDVEGWLKRDRERQAATEETPE